jgi:ubiquinone/menaquinone biosynthesis C-methylase UbiE
VSFCHAGIYDLALRQMERSCLHAWRSELLADVHGSVLELGAGTGHNLDCYPTSVQELTLVEPDPHMRHKLEKKLARHELRRRCTLLGATAESISSRAASFDAVVATLVLCSVDSVPMALAEVRRVLRPGGRLLLIEHIAAPQGSVRRHAQRLFEPIWKRLAGGCHLQRDPRFHLAKAGFIAEQALERDFRGVPGFIKAGLMGTWVAPGA